MAILEGDSVNDGLVWKLETLMSTFDPDTTSSTSAREKEDSTVGAIAEIAATGAVEGLFLCQTISVDVGSVGIGAVVEDPLDASIHLGHLGEDSLHHCFTTSHLV